MIAQLLRHLSLESVTPRFRLHGCGQLPMQYNAKPSEVCGTGCIVGDEELRRSQARGMSHGLG